MREKRVQRDQEIEVDLPDVHPQRQSIPPPHLWPCARPWRIVGFEPAGTRSACVSKIKHIAISTQDVEKTARFYIDVFGLKEVGKVDSPGASGYYLSDGDINLAILNFKSDAVAGAERGKQFSGIHHIGFQVESLGEIADRLSAAGSAPRDDVNQALGVGQGPRP